MSAQLLRHVRFLVTPWTVAHQAPLSVEFPRQEYWIALPSPLPGDLPDPETEPVSPGPPALAGRFFTADPPGKPFVNVCVLYLVTQWCLILCDPMDSSLPGSSVHGDSPGKNTGVGCHAFLQGIFPTQGSNSGLPHCRWSLYHRSHQGSPINV